MTLTKDESGMYHIVCNEEEMSELDDMVDYGYTELIGTSGSLTRSVIKQCIKTYEDL
jgi:hypothetical protein